MRVWSDPVSRKSREPNVGIIMVTKDYYQILQVDPNADQKDTAAAYRKLAIKPHPNRDSS